MVNYVTKLYNGRGNKVTICDISSLFYFENDFYSNYDFIFVLFEGRNIK